MTTASGNHTHQEQPTPPVRLDQLKEQRSHFPALEAFQEGPSQITPHPRQRSCEQRREEVNTLKRPDLKKPLIIQSEASSMGMAAVPHDGNLGERCLIAHTAPKCTTTEATMSDHARSSQEQDPETQQDIARIQVVQEDGAQQPSGEALLAAQQEVMEPCHDDKDSGHPGTDEIRRTMQAQFFWRPPTRDVRDHVAKRRICQQNEVNRRETARQHHQPQHYFEWKWAGPHRGTNRVKIHHRKAVPRRRRAMEGTRRWSPGLRAEGEIDAGGHAPQDGVVGNDGRGTLHPLQPFQ